MRYFTRKQTIEMSYEIWKVVTQKISSKRTFSYISTVKNEAISEVFPEHKWILSQNHYCPLCVEYFDIDKGCPECPGLPLWGEVSPNIAPCESLYSPYQHVRFDIIEDCVTENTIVEAKKIRDFFKNLLEENK